MSKFAARLAAAAFAAVAIAAPAAAEAPQGKANVAYGDLDLSSQAGQKELGRRIRSAAREVCGHDNSSLHAANVAAVQKCVNHAMREAAEDMNQAVASAAGRPEA